MDLSRLCKLYLLRGILRPESELHRAAASNDIKGVKAWYEAKGDINLNINGGPTLLHCAVFYGHLEMVRFLVENGAYLEHDMSLHMTPLHVALMERYFEIARYLITKGSDVNVRSIDGETILVEAFLYDCPHDILKLIIDKGADINVRSLEGNTVLHYAATSKKRLEALKLFLENGANIDAIELQMRGTALHIAANYGNSEAIKLLISKGAAMELKYKSGYTPLQVAVGNEHLKAAEELLKAGAVVNTQSEDGWTPLHVAAASGQYDMVKMLIRFDAALDYGGTFIGESPLHAAVRYGRLKITKYLLDSGADVNSTAAFNTVPLHVAIKFDQLDIVHALLDRGAYFNPRLSLFSDFLGIHRGTSYVKIKKLLISVSVLFGLIDKDDATKIDQFVKDKCIVNARDISTGNTSLHQAKSMPVVKCLLKHGAIFDMKNNSGKTPRDHSSNQDIVKLLKLVEELFGSAKTGGASLAEKLRGLDKGLLKAIRGARNSQGKTLLNLVESAKSSDSTQLSELIQEWDSSLKI